jgi:hypothetical protein
MGLRDGNAFQRRRSPSVVAPPGTPAISGAPAPRQAARAARISSGERFEAPPVNMGIGLCWSAGANSPRGLDGVLTRGGFFHRRGATLVSRMAAYLVMVRRGQLAPGAPRAATVGLLMRQLIECGKNKLDDPILMSWALRRYQDAQLRGSDLCRSMEEAWFHDLALRRWIDSGDPTLLGELFCVLPSRLFVNVRPGIVDRWITWSGGLGAKATTVLVECPLEVVLPLLAEHIDRNLLSWGRILESNSPVRCSF